MGGLTWLVLLLEDSGYGYLKPVLNKYVLALIFASRCDMCSFTESNEGALYGWWRRRRFLSRTRL